jgi:hypothetical protein
MPGFQPITNMHDVEYHLAQVTPPMEPRCVKQSGRHYDSTVNTRIV